MRVEMVRDDEGLAGLGPAWRALWEASASRPVNLYPSWIEAWWRTFCGGGGGGVGGGEGELAVVTVRDGADLVGVAPLYLTPPRGGALRARELRLLGDGIIGVRHA